MMGNEDWELEDSVMVEKSDVAGCRDTNGGRMREDGQACIEMWERRWYRLCT